MGKKLDENTITHFELYSIADETLVFYFYKAGDGESFSYFIAKNVKQIGIKIPNITQLYIIQYKNTPFGKSSKNNTVWFHYNYTCFVVVTHSSFLRIFHISTLRKFLELIKKEPKIMVLQTNIRFKLVLVYSTQNDYLFAEWCTTFCEEVIVLFGKFITKCLTEKANVSIFGTHM